MAGICYQICTYQLTSMDTSRIEVSSVDSFSQINFLYSL